MKCILYPRVSSLAQLDGTSMQTQEAECREWAERNGYTVEAVFREEGVSAKTADRRCLIEALEFLRHQDGEIDAFVVWKIDRFARSSHDYHVLRASLLGMGCHLISVTEPIDDSPAGRLMGSIIADIAQFDNEVRAQRAKTSMQELAQSGYWVWMAPTGYACARTPDGRPTLEPDEHAPAISRAFEMILSGKTQADARRFLHAAGVRGARGGTLSAQGVRQILENPIYAARLVSKLTGGVPVPGRWGPLVSSSVFDRVQGILTGTAQQVPRHRTREEFPLRGWVRCGICERPMTASFSRGKSGKRYPYYHCPTCRGQRASLLDFEGAWEDHLAAHALNEDETTLWMETVRRELSGALRQASHARTERRKKLTRLHNQRERLIDLLADGTLDAQSYKRKSIEINNEIAILELDDTPQKLEEMDLDAAIRFAGTLSSNPARMWKKAGFQGKREIQSLFFPGGASWTKAGFRTPQKHCALTAYSRQGAACQKWHASYDRVGTLVDFMGRCEAVRLLVA